MRRTFLATRALSLAGAIALALGLSAIPFAPAGAQAPAKAPGTAKPWVAPRTSDGHPDFQGNWSNATQTPFERMGNGPHADRRAGGRARETCSGRGGIPRPAH